MSDGVFAFAMTLLVIYLHVPASEAIHTIAQALYALGAALCLPERYFGIRGTYVSIAVIVLVHLNYALAPRIRPLYRL